MRAVIYPGRASGTAAAPPSKSMAHRLLICAGLARGKSVIGRVAPSEDVLATLDCLRALGAEAEYGNDTVVISGCDPSRAESALLNCRESGSTLRFFAPLCLLSGKKMILRGTEKLLSRPLSVYEDICREQGLEFEAKRDELTLCGRLKTGEYRVPGGVSSQFISGLLFALPLLPEASAIHLIPPVESASYIDMTVQALNEFGIEIKRPDGLTLIVPGGKRYMPRELDVEGDWSNAAFLSALGIVGGGVSVTGLKDDSLQGDKVYKEYFSRLEAGKAELDVSDCPDLAPVLMALAAAEHGCVLTGTRRLKYKESDRGQAMAAELAKFGVKVLRGENEITVGADGLSAPREALSSHNDHRVAMALSVLCTITGGTIDGAQAVSKSFPDYWDKIRQLGIRVETDGMDQR